MGDLEKQKAFAEWCWCIIQEQALISMRQKDLGISTEDVCNSPEFRSVLHRLRRKACKIASDLGLSKEEIHGVREQALTADAEVLWAAAEWLERGKLDGP